MSFAACATRLAYPLGFFIDAGRSKSARFRLTGTTDGTFNGGECFGKGGQLKTTVISSCYSSNFSAINILLSRMFQYFPHCLNPINTVAAAPVAVASLKRCKSPIQSLVASFLAVVPFGPPDLCATFTT